MFCITKICETLVSSTGLITAKRKHGIGKNQMPGRRKQCGELTYNCIEILRVVEDFCSKLYHSDTQLEKATIIEIGEIPVHSVNFQN